MTNKSYDQITQTLSLIHICNFTHAMENAAYQNTGQHMLQRYAIESSMLGYVLGGAPYSTEKLKEYALRMTDYSDGGNRLIAVSYTHLNRLGRVKSDTFGRASKISRINRVLST